MELQSLLEQCCCWSIPCYALKFDLPRAFARLDIALVYESLTLRPLIDTREVEIVFEIFRPMPIFSVIEP